MMAVKTAQAPRDYMKLLEKSGFTKFFENHRFYFKFVFKFLFDHLR